VYKILSKLVDECWRYSKPNQCHFWAWLKRPIFGVLDSQGSAETLVRRGGITNYHLMAYSSSNISAKNYQNRLMCIEVIAKNVIVVFFETQFTLSSIAYHGQDECWYSYTEQFQSNFCAHDTRCACLFLDLCTPSQDQSQWCEWHCVCYLNVGRSRNSLASHLGRLNAWNAHIPFDVSINSINSCKFILLKSIR